MVDYAPPAATVTLTSVASTGQSFTPPAAVISLVPPPPPVLVFTRATIKWVFADDTETHKFSINPDSMTSPLPTKQLAFGQAVGPDYGRYATLMAPGKPVEWEFSGVLRTQAEHDVFQHWADKPGLVRVTDHLNRTFEIMISSFEVTERTPTKTVKWRLRYTMKTLILRQIS